MKKKHILFICTYNGARSRIAEAFMNQSAPDTVEAFSASFESGKIGRLPIDIMHEIGIDISQEAPVSVFQRHKNREPFDWVIALCDKVATEQCPIFMTSIDVLFAAKAKMLSWSVPSFQSLKGTPEERTAKARDIRDLIKQNVILLLDQLQETEQSS